MHQTYQVGKQPPTRHNNMYIYKNYVAALQGEHLNKNPKTERNMRLYTSWDANPYNKPKTTTICASRQLKTINEEKTAFVIISCDKLMWLLQSTCFRLLGLCDVFPVTLMKMCFITIYKCHAAVRWPVSFGKKQCHGSLYLHFYFILVFTRDTSSLVKKASTILFTTCVLTSVFLIY